MRIQHNIMAMSAYRNYTNNVSAMKKNLEKLSSGYKINRAGDDAAGLAISEKMRAQITGLETAQKNAKDGISLVQTAEGALTEVHDMLNRMVELATQSANGTYDNTTDRYQLQKEMDQLRSEIDRIADSSNFNGIKLLDGSLSSAGTREVAINIINDSKLAGNKTAQAGKYELDLSQLTLTNSTGATQTVTIKIGDVGSFTVDVGANTTVSAANLTPTLASGTAGSFAPDGVGVTVSFNLTTGKISFQMDKAPSADWNANMTVSVSGASDYNTGETLGVKITQEAVTTTSRKWAQGEFDLSTLNITDGSTLEIGGQTYTFKVGANGKGAGGTVIDLTNYEEGDADLAKAAARVLSKQTNDKFNITSQNNNTKVQLTEKKAAGEKNDSKVDYEVNDLQGSTSVAKDGNWAGLVKFTASATGGAGGLTLQIGDTAENFNQLNVSVEDCHTTALGIAGISIANQSSAQAAVKAIKEAINKVSDVRGTLGATQNRLDHTINNLSVMTENIQDAESTIRDVDIAEEMMAYTKNNILIQSAQAMLAQANQVPQGVLQLLQ